MAARIFHTGHAPVRTEIGGREYDVPAHAECAIPEQFAYVIEARSLALHAGELPGAGAATVRVNGKRVVPVVAPMPPGTSVSTLSAADAERILDGGEIEEPDDEGDEEEPSEAPSTAADAEQDAEGGNEVNTAVANLRAQGMTLPGAKKRRR